jgi:hypothetical protein
LVGIVGAALVAALLLIPVVVATVILLLLRLVLQWLLTATATIYCPLMACCSFFVFYVEFRQSRLVLLK